MQFPWKIVKRSFTPADEKLDKIKEILFPDFERQTLSNGDKTLIDYSIDSNLESALSDLEDGINDPTLRKTIRLSIDRLIEIRKLLEAYGEFDMGAKYVVVDDMSRKEDPIDEKVQAKE